LRVVLAAQLLLPPPGRYWSNHVRLGRSVGDVRKPNLALGKDDAGDRVAVDHIIVEIKAADSELATRSTA
jgi:hypothetical protein